MNSEAHQRRTAATSAAVLSLLQSGKLEQAETAAEKLLQEAPDDRHAVYARGLVYLMRGDPVGSIPWLEKAVALHPESATYHCNLGVAHLRAHAPDKAIPPLLAAIARKPKYEEARYNLGCAYLDDGQLDAADSEFEALAKAHPAKGKYVCAQGDVLRARDDWPAAATAYRKAVEVDPTTARAWVNLAPILMHSDRLDEAIEASRRAIELDPKEVVARKNLGDCLVRQEAFEEAMSAYADAYEIDADSADLCVAIGKLWFETGESAEASTWFNKAIVLDAEHIEAQCCFANLIKESGDAAQAIEILEGLLEAKPDHVGVLVALADARWEEGDADAAIAHLRRVQELQPGRLAVYGKIGQILSSSGNVEAALEQYRAALRLNPICIPALNGLATTQRGKLDADNADRMKRLLSDPRLRANSLGSLQSGLAYYADGKNDYEAAAEYARLANAHQWESRTKRGWCYEPSEFEAHVSELIETFGRDYFDRVESLGNPDETPVFIVGMPRSGTTLTEQILARHSKVLGVGERGFAAQTFNQFCPPQDGDAGRDFSRFDSIDSETIAPIAQDYLARLELLKKKADALDVERVVDKMPDNYSQLGWILTLFPRAKIIHCRRDPRDVALSCWMTQFGAIRWACDTEHLSKRILQYQRIMNHWREVIPDRFLELDYENLVADQESESKRLIEWLGLEWEPACLSFYESDRLVRTASITQVRQPIYKRSVAKWKAYAPYLSDLFDPISPV